MDEVFFSLTAASQLMRISMRTDKCFVTCDIVIKYE